MKDRFVNNRIRILVADGSAFDGMQIAKILDEDNGIEVVGRAKTGEETLHMVDDLNPDVMTLDSNMPGMDGPAILKRIFSKHSVPTVMVCSLTPEQSRVAFDALRYGAIDVMSKPSFEDADSLEAWKTTIVFKVKRAARVGSGPCRHLGISNSEQKPKKPKPSSPDSFTRFIGIGAGPDAYHSLVRLVTSLSPSFRDVIIAKVVGTLPCPEAVASYLNEYSAIRVNHYRHATFLEKGTCYLCGPGTRVFLNRDEKGRVSLIREDPHDPATGKGDVDRLFQSLAFVAGKQTTGVILSGPGSDGAGGMSEIRRAGGRTVIQETSNCLDPSMPRAVLDRIAVDAAVPDYLIGDYLMNSSEAVEEGDLTPENAGYGFSTASEDRESFCGYVQGVDVIEFLQFVLLTGKPMVLELFSNSGTRGKIFLSNGNVLHAMCGKREGERALYECLAFEAGRFFTRPWREPTRETIRKPGELLLVEAARRRDEGRRDTGTAQENATGGTYV